MANVVTAIFKTRSSAVRAAEDLIRHGFPQEDVSMLLTDSTNGREVAVAKSTEAAKGALVGIGVFGPVLALVSWLMAAGYIPAFLAALQSISPSIAALAGLGFGTILGVIPGALIGARTPVYQASFFSTQPIGAGILMGVYTDSATTLEARKVLDAAGGADVCEREVSTVPLIRTRSTDEQDMKISQ